MVKYGPKMVVTKPKYCSFYSIRKLVQCNVYYNLLLRLFDFDKLSEQLLALKKKTKIF